MTDAQILSMYEELIDGQSTLSDNLKIALANTTKIKLETELRLQIHKKLGVINVVTGQKVYTLPTDFFMGYGRAYLNNKELFERPFDELWNTDYSIDYVAKTLTLNFSPTQSYTLKFPYLYRTPDITAATVATGTTSSITWQDFAMLLPLQMARDWYTVDAGDKGRSWAQEYENMYQELKKAIINWDTQLKLSAISHQIPYGLNYEQE